MAFPAKVVTVKGLVLAVAFLLFGQSNNVRAGCGDHVELAGVVAHSGTLPLPTPVKERPCSGPQCSKKSQGLPAIPVEVQNKWVEKTDLVSLFEWKNCVQVERRSFSSLDVLSSAGHPAGIFHPPRS